MRWTVLGALGVALLAGSALSEDAGLKADRRMAMADLDEENALSLKLEVGPVTITEIRVRNAPSPEEVAGAKNDNSHPHPTVTAENHGPSNVRLVLRTSLEDEQGHAFMTCQRYVKLPAGKTDRWTICFMEHMKTADWSRVKTVHLETEVELKN
ncbi:MAG TPA: hypothetical protein VFG59_08780 [Anaeromyxobacter sp.]|nr:hypothetical protein [Anaeromyxobacter sp.]